MSLSPFAVEIPPRSPDRFRAVLDPEQVVHQCAIAILEDAQWDLHAGVEHRVEREHRQFVGHASDTSGARPTGVADTVTGVHRP